MPRSSSMDAVEFARGLGHARRHRMLFGLVLGIGGRAHRVQRIVVLAFGIEHPGGRDLPLNIDLLRPIGVLRVTQLVAQLGELGDVGLGGFRIARAGRAERARKMSDRLHVRQRAGTDLKFRRGLPVAALHRVARRRNGQRIWPGHESLGETR